MDGVLSYFTMGRLTENKLTDLKSPHKPIKFDNSSMENELGMFGRALCTNEGKSHVLLDNTKICSSSGESCFFSLWLKHQCAEKLEHDVFIVRINSVTLACTPPPTTVTPPNEAQQQNNTNTAMVSLFHGNCEYKIVVKFGLWYHLAVSVSVGGQVALFVGGVKQTLPPCRQNNPPGGDSAGNAVVSGGEVCMDELMLSDKYLDGDKVHEKYLIKSGKYCHYVV